MNSLNERKLFKNVEGKIEYLNIIKNGFRYKKRLTLFNRSFSFNSKCRQNSVLTLFWPSTGKNMKSFLSSNQITRFEKFVVKN